MKNTKTINAIPEIENMNDALAKYPIRAASCTIAKMQKLSDAGYSFIAGNNYKLNKTKKWSGFDCIRVAQTNSRTHGKSIATMWAVKKI